MATHTTRSNDIADAVALAVVNEKARQFPMMSHDVCLDDTKHCLRIQRVQTMSFARLCIIVGLMCALSFGAKTTKPVALGIDLGNEWLKVCIQNTSAIIPFEIAVNDQSNRKTPSLIAFHKNERVFGDHAEFLCNRYPDKVYTHLNRVFGKKVESNYVQQFVKVCI